MRPRDNRTPIIPVPAQPSTTPAPPTVEKRQVTEIVPVPFDEQGVDDESLPRGTRVVLVPGVNGEKTQTYEVTLVDGVETDRRLMSEAVTRQPVTQSSPSAPSRSPGATRTTAGHACQSPPTSTAPADPGTAPRTCEDPYVSSARTSTISTAMATASAANRTCATPVRHYGRSTHGHHRRPPVIPHDDASGTPCRPRSRRPRRGARGDRAMARSTHGRIVQDERTRPCRWNWDCGVSTASRCG